MEENKVQRVEISFGVPVTLPDGWERALDGLIGMVCDQYKREHPDRVMWPAGMGCKPRWSQADAAFLGKPTDAAAPDTGEPTWDDSVFVIECEEREDYHGSNPHNPNRAALREAASAERMAAKAARRKWPSSVGVSRDAGNARTLCIAFDREPTDDEMRALHDGLRDA